MKQFNKLSVACLLLYTFKPGLRLIICIPLLKYVEKYDMFIFKTHLCAYIGI